MEVKSHEYNIPFLKRFQGILEAIYHHLGGEMDFLSFQETLGKDILADVLEAKDQYIWEHKEERKDWEVVRRDDPKEILTILVRLDIKGLITVTIKLNSMPI